MESPYPKAFLNFLSFLDAFPKLWSIYLAGEFSYLSVLYSQLLTFCMHPGVLPKKSFVLKRNACLGGRYSCRLL